MSCKRSARYIVHATQCVYLVVIFAVRDTQSKHLSETTIFQTAWRTLGQLESDNEIGGQTNSMNSLNVMSYFTYWLPSPLPMVETFHYVFM